MSRPQKLKQISKKPNYTHFIAKGKLHTHPINLLVEEYETIRCIDYLGYTQQECANQMNVARTTVQALYEQARIKIARHLIEGSELIILGGQYQVNDIKEEKNMKIAITYENGEVFQHFGRCENFKIYDVVNGKIEKAEVINSNGIGHGALAGVLANHQVDILICGGIGAGAKFALAEVNIQVYPGAMGDVDKQVEAFIQGNLNFDPNIECHHHDHEDHNCEGHGCGHGCTNHHEPSCGL